MSDIAARKRHSWLDVYKEYLADVAAEEQAARQHVAVIDEILFQHWQLGHNLVLQWAPLEKGLLLLVIRHYQLVETVDGQLPVDAGWISREIVSANKQATPERLADAAKHFGTEPIRVELAFDPLKELSGELISALVRRYSVSMVQDRAVALFDAVGFSLLSPLEQVTQLNSLSYSVNAAYSKLLDKAIEIAFSRTTTGDGFYIWNRNASIQGNIDLYHFVQLILADNAIAHSKARGPSTPLLRTCFHVGSHYEFFQEEGLSPSSLSYIVGDVTIELARMIDKALPGQILVGDFEVPMLVPGSDAVEWIDTVEFITRTMGTLSDLEDVELSGDRVESIHCYLTGPQHNDGRYGILRYRVADKHGLTHDVYNAKVNILRYEKEPIYLGIQESGMNHFDVLRVEEFGDGVLGEA